MADETKEVKEPKVAKKAKAKTYYAKQKKMSVSYPLQDENGKEVLLYDNAGNVKRGYGGKPLVQMSELTFSRVSRKDKHDYLSMFTTEDPYLQKVLDAEVEKPYSPIMSETQYKKLENAAAFAMEEKYTKAIEENQVLVSALDSKDKVLEDQQREIEQLRSKLKGR